jgi:hypothetical protein
LDLVKWGTSHASTATARATLTQAMDRLTPPSHSGTRGLCSVTVNSHFCSWSDNSYAVLTKEAISSDMNERVEICGVRLLVMVVALSEGWWCCAGANFGAGRFHQKEKRLTAEHCTKMPLGQHRRLGPQRSSHFGAVSASRKCCRGRLSMFTELPSAWVPI